MERTEMIKERIIAVTTELIEQYQGNTSQITSRMIAERAGIGLGLINYHFGSKDALITECVQRIIGTVITAFEMEQDFEADQDRLAACAVHVFHFLFSHSAISRISILGDFQNYAANCNSVLTQQGFALSLKDSSSDADKSLLVFILTAAMQTAFLGRETAKQVLGYDFTKEEEREAYIKKLVDILFNGMAKG